ncbi:MAG: hypothetical protein DHS20C15_10170 [Planctomycetota bacterium]|nr:MAG: hypothetical protein DHS20C15_10170 [Planctomycetota bacterium]
MSAHRLTLRPRYGEVDSMGIVYHAHYLVYFDQGRTELLRDLGMSYAEIEAQGHRLAVVDAGLRYLSPARYDDELQLETELASVRGASVVFGYRLSRGDELLATGHTKLGCLDLHNRPCALPPELRKLLRAGRAAAHGASELP